MNIEDHEKIFDQLSKNENHGRLAVLNAPTGCGKSYSVIDFLCNHAVKNQKFRAFFVTDQKKNLSLDLFQECWTNQKNVVSNLTIPFYKKVATIRSLTDTVRLLINDFENKNIPNLIRTPNLEKGFDDLRDSFNLYEIIQNQNSNSINGWYDLEKAELAFRKILAKEIALLGHIEQYGFENKESQNSIREFLRKSPQNLQKLIYKIYPTIDLQNYQIFLCTTDKFIRSYTPFFNADSKLFLYSDIIKNNLVVLDEFDSTKSRIWNKSLNDALTIKVDLLTLFDIIYQGLKRIDENVPQQLKDILTKDNSNLHYLNIAKDLNKEFKLSYLYKIKGTVTPNTFVIHTPVNTILSNKNYWYSHFIEKKKQVIVDNKKDNNLRFNSMLSRVSKFIKSFNQYILNCARQYMSERNSTVNSLDSAINQVDACWTIYRALRLDDNQIKMLMNSSLNGLTQTIKSNSKLENIDNSHEFQKNGLELYRFVNSEQHDLQTEINASFLSITAENYLLELVSKCMVYGLSATASIPTVLDNYDLNYLKEKLNHNFIDGRNCLTTDTKKEFDYDKRYKEHGISVNCEIVGMYDNIKDLLKDRLKNKNVKIDWNKIREIDSDFKKIQNKIAINGKKEVNYFKQRYMSLFESFVYFLLDSNLTSFLGLQSKLPDKTEYMSQKLIQQVFDVLSDQLCESRNVKLCFISNTNGDIQNQLQESLNWSSKGKRTYLLSAYLSIGVGQNLQHNITYSEKERCECIAFDNVSKNDKRLKQIDLGGIYLGDVTHVLTKVNDF